jgi:hypothetical protein
MSTAAPTRPNKRVEYEGVRRRLENGSEERGLGGRADWGTRRMLGDGDLVVKSRPRN